MNATRAEKQRAHALVTRAIKRGELVRKPCRVCGNPRSHGHHTNYARPLSVRWLCAEHHKAAHAKPNNSTKDPVTVRACRLRNCMKMAMVNGRCWMHDKRLKRKKAKKTA